MVMRRAWLKRTLVAATFATMAAPAAGCYPILRGRVATGPDRTELTGGLQIIAPADPVSFVSVFTNRDVVAAVARHLRDDVPLFVHGGGLWRFEEDAFGAELGATLIFAKGRALAGIGVQASTGDTGTTAAYLTLGYDIGGLLCGSCFSGALTED